MLKCGKVLHMDHMNSTAQYVFDGLIQRAAVICSADDWIRYDHQLVRRPPTQYAIGKSLPYRCRITCSLRMVDKHATSVNKLHGVRVTRQSMPLVG